MRTGRIAAAVACLVSVSIGFTLAACGGGGASNTSGETGQDASGASSGSGSGSGGTTSSGSSGSGGSSGGRGGSSGGDDGGVIDAGAVDAPIATGDASAGCGTAATAGMHDVTIQSGGMARTFHVYVPAKYATATSTPDSLVFVFHGYTQVGTGNTFTSIEYLSQMDPVSDAQGFLLVYPDGYMNSWNAGDCCGAAVSSNVDDVGFFDDMLAWVESKYCVDPKRVYSAGLSNGGFFSNRLGCERANVVAAIGPVAGPLDITPCSPSRPVPVFEVHGTADPVVFFDGGSSSEALPVEQAISTWEGFDKCTDSMPANVYTNGSAACTEETMCSAGSAVELCVIAGGGHQWPGGKDDYLGNFSSDLDTSTAMIKFFQEHPMP